MIITVAGPFAKAVHRHLHLRGTGLHCGDGVCHGKAEVVVAVDIERAVDLAGKPAHQGLHTGRRDNPHGVRDVDDRRPGPCGSLTDLDKIVMVRPRRIHGREHAQVDMVPGVMDDFFGD